MSDTVGTITPPMDYNTTARYLISIGLSCVSAYDFTRFAARRPESFNLFPSGKRVKITHASGPRKWAVECMFTVEVKPGNPDATEQATDAYLVTRESDGFPVDVTFLPGDGFYELFT